MRFLTDDNDFHCFSIVHKDFDGLLMNEIGWSGFSIDEVSFHSFSINHINSPGFSFKETGFQALHLYEIVSPGDPLVGVILILLSPLMKAVFINSTSEEEISKNFLRWYSLRLSSNQFNWFPLIFFQPKRCPRTFSQWNRFSKKSYTQTFSKKFHFTDFNLMDSNQSKWLFPLFQFENEFSPNSRWWCWFQQNFHGKNQLPWFLCARSSISWLSPEWKQVSWIFKNEINFYGFPFNILYASWSY